MLIYYSALIHDEIEYVEGLRDLLGGTEINFDGDPGDNVSANYFSPPTEEKPVVWNVALGRGNII